MTTRDLSFTGLETAEITLMKNKDGYFGWTDRYGVRPPYCPPAKRTLHGPYFVIES